MIEAQTADLLGGMLSGRYQIIKLLGQGGMAHVYLASDQKTGKNVAIKVMHDDLNNDPMSIKLFKTEARATSNLNHPNIVRTIGFGQDHEHRYIVQEYVEGGSLKELINKNGAIPWQMAVPMTLQIGLALDHAHAHALVHRDIKPQNILITEAKHAKVTDFGIAKATKSNTSTLTDGISFGSVHYASPEQARGSTVGEKSDIYSLGIVMYEMATGRVPFDSDTTVAVAIKHLQEIPPRPSLINSAVPRGLDQIIMKCIQKSPDNRYQNARELVDELDAFMTDPNGVYGIVAGLPDRDEQTTAIQAMSQEPKYNVLREIEQIIIKRRRSRRRDTVIVMAIIMATIFFVTSIGAWGWGKLSSTIRTEPNQFYELSDYIGHELSEVLEIMEKDNIMVDIVYSENPTVIVGLITAQKPSSGVKIKQPKDTVTLTVSSGPDLQVIPDLSGQLSAAAQTELRQTWGYKVTIVTENAQIDQGNVIRTIPAAGQKAPRGGSVILVVSDGMPLLKMPNFVGMSLTNARSQIMILGLVLGPVDSISGNVPEAKRVVIRQSVPAGSEITAQSVISFTYGTAQDYANFRNPTPTPTPFIVMPDLDRMSLASMKTLLTLQGLTSITLNYQSAENALLPESQLYVIEQLPTAGTKIKLAESVQILAGSMAEYDAIKNPVPTPEPTPTLTLTPTPSPTIEPTLTPTPSPTLAPATTPTSSPTTTAITPTSSPTTTASSPTTTTVPTTTPTTTTTTPTTTTPTTTTTTTTTTTPTMTTTTTTTTTTPTTATTSPTIETTITATILPSPT